MLKSLPKIITIIFLTVFILQMICLFFLLVVPAASQAIEFKPQVEIPGYTFNSADKTTGNIANLIKAIYKYAIGIVGILAAVVLMIGGVMWVVAGGSSTMISEAKAWIGASLTGLILALCSYLILATINPALVDLKTSSIPTVAPPLITSDKTKPCGLEIPGENIICGSKCPTGQVCKKITSDWGIYGAASSGALECPKTLKTNVNDASGNYWLCTSPNSNLRPCCINNDDSQCQTGLVCNEGMTRMADCNKGTCVAKQPKDGICKENKDCISDRCNTSILNTEISRCLNPLN